MSGLEISSSRQPSCMVIAFVYLQQVSVTFPPVVPYQNIYHFWRAGMKMTVFFDGGFWFGLVEYQDKQLGYQAFRYPFGKEPKDSEILDFVYRHLTELMQKQERLGLVSDEPDTSLVHKSINPKRMQREISKQLKQPALSSKAQHAMQASHELLKLEKKASKRQKRQEYKERQFQLKQEKRRQKKKGH